MRALLVVLWWRALLITLLVIAAGNAVKGNTLLAALNLGWSFAVAGVMIQRRVRRQP